jgi:hypothetical protein
MGFIVFMIVLWIIISVVAQNANKAKQARAQSQLPPDFFGTFNVPPEHVRQVGGAPAAVLPARVPGEESTSELMWDETAADHDLNLDHAEVISLEPTEVADLSVEARPSRGPAQSLETEVDWEAEHERFHKRYVDVRAPTPAAAHGLLDDLRDPAIARRAVLMAEILGPPVSLRGSR